MGLLRRQQSKAPDCPHADGDVRRHMRPHETPLRGFPQIQWLWMVTSRGQELLHPSSMQTDGVLRKSLSSVLGPHPYHLSSSLSLFLSCWGVCILCVSGVRSLVSVGV